MPRTPTIDPELRLWPRLTRFYGIGPSELARTPRWLVRLYAEAMNGLQAEEQMSAIYAAGVPYMDNGSKYMDAVRQRISDTRITGDVTERERRQDAKIDGARLSAMGIGLVKTPPKKEADVA